MHPLSLAILTAMFSLLTVQKHADKRPVVVENAQQSRWAEVTHKFESAPLDKAAALDAADAVDQMRDASGFQVRTCQALVNELRSSAYKYHMEVLRLYVLGAATYQIESHKTDSEGTNLYALHSVLKGYAAILRQEPSATDKRLDDFAALDANGELPHLIERRGCL